MILVRDWDALFGPFFAAERWGIWTMVQWSPSGMLYELG